MALTDQELAAWGGLLRTHARLVRELDAELTLEHRLPLSSYEVLLRLANSETGGMRMSEIADAVLLSRSGLTRLVDRLEAKQLVRRGRHPDDRRSVVIELTEAGRALVPKLPPVFGRVTSQLLAGFSADEITVLTGMLQRMRSNLRP